VADDRRVNAQAPVLAHVQERGALRRADPLVQVACVIRRADRAHVEREQAGGVRSVDERVDSASGQLIDDRRDGEDQRRLAGDVIDEEQARAIGDLLQHALHDHVRGGDGERHVHFDDLRAIDSRDVVERVARGVVLLRRHQQLVVLVEVERAQYGIHACRGVGDESHAGGIGADELRQLLAGGIQQRLQLANEETHRLPLHLRAILVLLFQHDARRRAERAVVEESDRGVQRPVLLHTAVFTGR
jgi:hypothetical protein